MSMMKMGIDVSEYQGEINWEKVKSAGVQFAILRTVKRNGKIDSQLANNIKGCLDNGIQLFYYLHSYALTEDDGVDEALAVVAALKELGVYPSEEITLYYDVEWDEQMKLSTEKLTEIAQAFKAVVVSSGFSFGLYMGMSDFNDEEINLPMLGETHIWLARYYDGYKLKNFGEMPDENYKPKVKNGTLCGWQWTSSGRVPGINAYVDMNVMYCDIGAEAKAEKEAEGKQNTKSAAKVVELATQWLGKKESDGSHREIIDIYNSYTPRARGYKLSYTDPWCAGFVSAVSIKLGYTDIIPPECSCNCMIQLFKELGEGKCWMEDDDYVPCVGDLVFYDWQDTGKGDNIGWPDHVGIVVLVDEARGEFTVIEGNKNGCVNYRSMKLGGKYIRGFAAPAYDVIDYPESGDAKKKVNPYREPVYTLYMGKSGMDKQDIMWLQWELVRTGYLEWTYKNSKGQWVDSVDGLLGKLTDAAVEAFQRDYPDTYSTKNPDKKVGPKTRAALKLAPTK